MNCSTGTPSRPSLADPALDDDEAITLLHREMQRQTQTRWLDEHVPALGGLTPRDAAVDPTHREQLERLLDEFDASDRRMSQLAESSDADSDAVSGLISFDVAALRRELGLD